MKWIKYQILQSAIGEEIVLATKKVGYSNENLAIAQKEAYNGYEIIDDSQSFEKEPLGVEVGGTGAKDAETARQKLGVTPKNIGALPATGGTLTGGINVDSGASYAALTVNRTTNEKKHTAAMHIATGTSKAEFVYLQDGTIKSVVSLSEKGVELSKALGVEFGGHGATTPEQARQNLGIVPENIGAVKESEYYGPIKKEGSICQAKCYEGTGIHVVTEFSPKQEGSGDPYPAGGGKNLCDASLESTDNVNGLNITRTANGNYILNGACNSNGVRVVSILTLEPKTYTLSFTEISGSVSNRGEKFAVAQLWDNAANVALVSLREDLKSVSYTLTEKKEVYIRLYTAAGKTYSDWEIGIQLEKGSAATEYAPYSNIRPISGYDKLELNHAGKNLVEKVVYGYIAAGSSEPNFNLDNDSVSAVIRVVKGQRYKISCAVPLDRLTVAKTETAEFAAQQKLTNAKDFPISELAFTAEFTGIAVVYIKATKDESVKDSLQIELGSVASPYESYQGNTYTVQIGQTVYGGKFDWLTGKLTAEWYSEELQNATDWWMSSDGWFRHELDHIVYGEQMKPNVLFCTHYLSGPSKTLRTVIGGKVHGTLRVYNSGFTNLEDWKAFLSAQKAAGTPVQIVYKLATPIEIQLDKIGAIEALNGTNTIYSNVDKCIVEFGHQMVKSEFVTTEEPTGQVWIDGKPIYRQVFTISGEYGSTEGSYSVIQVGNIKPLETVVNFYGTVVNHFGGKPSAYYPISAGARPSQTDDNAFVGGQIFNGGNVTLYVQGVKVHSGHVVVEYTKADE